MNTYKLSGKEVKYSINGNKVICNVVFTFKAKPFIPSNMYNHKAISTIKSNSKVNVKDSSITEILLNIRAKGIATCGPKDTFNEELGKRISYSKAVIEGYKKYYQIVSTASEALAVKVIDMYDNKERLIGIIDREQKHLEELKNS